MNPAPLGGAQRASNAAPPADRLKLFAIAFVVRLAALMLAARIGRFPEFWEYEVIAHNLLTGRGFVYTHMGLERHAYVEPLYPLFVTAVYLVTGASVWALALVQCAVSSLVAIVIYEFARLMFDRRTAIAAGLIVIIHPGLAANAVRFHVVTFDMLGIATVALCAMLWMREPRPGPAALFGAVTGACVLTRPTILARLHAQPCRVRLLARQSSRRDRRRRRSRRPDRQPLALRPRTCELP